MQPWWERHKGRLAWEEGEFARRGLPAKVDIRGTALEVVITTALPFMGEMLPIEVVLGPEYPDAPPSVRGLESVLARHQHPHGFNFCLGEAAEGPDWWPAFDAAHLVDEDLRWLLADAETGGAAVREAEADLPEPASAFIPYSPGSVLFVPAPFWQPPSAEMGTLRALADRGRGRAVVTQADGFDSPDASLVHAVAPVGAGEWRGSWFACDQAPPPYPSVEQLQTMLGTERLDQALRVAGATPRRSALLALTFPEEGPRRGEFRRSWVAARVKRYPGGRLRLVAWLHAQALTAEERRLRTPELGGLEGSRVVVVGAGSLGAPVVLELAKAGVGRIDVIDDDRYDTNNSVRHVLPARWAGWSKAAGVAHVARSLNPFIEVERHVWRIGSGAESFRILRDLVAQADVVVDTTGSTTVARVLTSCCREHEVDLIVAGLTGGGRGGDLGVFSPSGPCWYCMMLHQAEGTVPVPPANPGRPTTPIGCSHPAYTGAGFEATELAAVTARATIATTRKCSYPPIGFSWAVIDFGGAPRWQQGHLERHVDCPVCQP